MDDAMKLSEHNENFLFAYLQGDIGEDELHEWLISIDDAEEVPQAERDVLAGLRLILIEWDEGMRELDEVKQEAAALLACSRGEPISSPSASSTTPRLEVTAA